MTIREKLNERKSTKKKSGFFSPDLATPRAIDSLKDSGFSSMTLKAYLKTLIPFSQTVNDIRHARKDKIEKGSGTLGNFIGYKVKDLIYAVPYAIQLYSSGGTTAISDVERGLKLEAGKQDIDYKEAVTVAKQTKEFYDKTKKAKEAKTE